MFDFKQKGFQSWVFSHPPKIPSEDEIMSYDDSLKEILEDKVKELVDHIELLEKEKKEDLKTIKSIKREQNIDDMTEYFLTLWAEIKFAEVNYAQKWLRYWMKIRDVVMHTKDMIRIDQEDSNITESEITRAKNHPIEDLFDGQLRKSGARFMGRCPFHKENTASFTIFTNNNSYHCFGCGAHGDAIDFMMKTKNIRWADAVWSLL